MFRNLTGSKPKVALPAGAIDCHMHFFDDTKYTGPEGASGPENALISQYDQVREWLGIERMVVTQGNFYRLDNQCTLDVLAHYGDKARAIVAVDAAITDAELQDMTDKGVRGARIMDLMGAPIGLSKMLEVNRRVVNFDWSMIVQFDGRQILEHNTVLEQIEGKYVIDHVGKFLEPVKENSAEFAALLRLMDKGNCYVKIAACYETSKVGYPSFSDVGTLAQKLIEHAPDRVVWGTNWPHLMSQSADTYPDDVNLLNLVNEWAGSDANRQKLFVDNPAALYGF